jgi:hypothetical protein
MSNASGGAAARRGSRARPAPRDGAEGEAAAVAALMLPLRFPAPFRQEPLAERNRMFPAEPDG